MRTVHLYCNRDSDRETLVAGIGSSSEVDSLHIVQDDAVRFVVHSLRRNPAVPSLAPFVEETLDFTAIRVSLGVIDQAPATGSFRFKVGTDLGAVLTWPADLSTPGLKLAWKAALLAALIALPSVGANAVKLDDPANTPANFVYFTWTDPTRTDVIEVVENRLQPLTSAKARPSPTPGGYSQLIKFILQPVAMTTGFVRPLPPAAAIVETRPGAAGVNAEQTLVIPTGAMGGLSLGWSGVATSVMGVDNLTSGQIATQLNNIVPAGSSNASFIVTERPSQAGRRLAIEFTGPLAAHLQPLLTVTMSDQIGLPYATGKLDLSQSGLAIEQVLSGAADAEIKLELVITTAEGEETYLADVDLINDMTSGSTVSEIEAAGAVLVLQTIAYVEADPQPYFEVAPGLSYTPAQSADIYEITHNLDTWYPSVRLSQKTGSDPQIWRVLPDNEYAAEAISPSRLRLTMPVQLSENPGSVNYFGNFKVFISSPEATVRVFEHQHTWDEVRASLPDGLTLRAKLASLDAALGIIGGSLSISASNITGLLSASQIDLPDVSQALQNTSAFLTTLRNLSSDTQWLNVIGSGLNASTTFATTLTKLLAGDDIRSGLITALSTDTGFLAIARKVALEVLQSGVFPDGSILMEIADIDRTIAPLLSAVTVTGSLGNITGLAPRADSTNAGKKYIVVQKAHSNFRGINGLEQTVFAPGDTIVSNGVRWFAADIVSGTAFPAFLEMELFRLPISAAMLTPRTRFSVAFTVSLALQDASISGQCVLQVRLGKATVDAGPVNIKGIDWLETPVIEQLVSLTPAKIYHTFRYSVDTDYLGVLTSEKTVYAATSSATAPASAPFFLQARIVRLDVENQPSAPTGSLVVQMAKAKASIVKV